MLNFKCMRCKYSFTDEQLPASPWKQTKEQKTNDPDVIDKSFSDEEELVKILTEVAKNVKCPKCQSTAYLTGIGEKKNFEIDLTSEPLVQLVKRAIELVKSNRKEDVSKYLEYRERIIDILILDPGKLIYFADPELIKEAESAFNIIWDNNVDTDELFYALHSEVMVGMTVDYIRRAIKLKPTLVSVKPDNIVAAYFSNVIEAWLFGLNSAALILCCSVIEQILNQKFPVLKYKSDKILRDFKSLRDIERTLEEFIDEVARQGFIDEKIRIMAQNIRTLRNSAVHKLKPISSDEAYNAIMSTKKIIEQLLK
jgi:hypothetical protein